MRVFQVAILLAGLVLAGCAASYGVQFTRLTDAAYEAAPETAEIPVLISLPTDRRSIVVGIANVTGKSSFADLLNRVRAKAREVGGQALIEVQTNTSMRTSTREKTTLRTGSTFGASQPSAPPEKEVVTEEVHTVSAKVLRFVD